MEKTVPKRAFTFINVEKGEEIYEVCIKLKDVCGAVYKTAKVLSDANINIRTSSLFLTEDNADAGYWTSFVDASKAKNSIAEVEAKLRKLDVVEDVVIAKPQPLAYDIIHFPITHGSSPAIIMPIELFGSLFEEIERILTPSGFAAVFYNAGKKSGTFIAELLTNRNRLNKEQLKLAVIQATRAIGWGRIVDFNIKGETARVKIEKCFEALLRGRKKEKVCHWTRGFIAGFLSATEGKPMETVELKCLANGDETCEFEVKPCT